MLSTKTNQYSFVVNFTIPYLVDAQYADLGSKVGFIFGSLCVCAFVTTYLFVPECRGKTLEEIDVMFNSGVKLSKFGSTDASLLSARPQSSKNAETEIEVLVEKQGEFAGV